MPRPHPSPPISRAQTAHKESVTTDADSFRKLENPWFRSTKTAYATTTTVSPPRVHRQLEGRRNKNAISLLSTAAVVAFLMILRRNRSPSASVSEDGRRLRGDKTKNVTKQLSSGLIMTQVQVRNSSHRPSRRIVRREAKLDPEHCRTCGKP